MVDVLLIKPDFKDIAIMPPLGLGYLAAKLKQKGLSTIIHDNTLLGYGNDEISAMIKKTKPKIIGMYAATPMISRAQEIARLARSVNKDILITLGGPHPSCTVEETLQSGNVDVIIIGEGEDSLPEIALRFIEGRRDFSEVKGTAFLTSHNEIVRNPLRDMIENLDSLPFPDLEIMPIDHYFRKQCNYGITQKTSRSLPIIASRGCPSNCTFCQRFMGRRFRTRSAQNIVDELIYWKNKFAISDFNFLDDNFTLNKKGVIEVCDRIHKKNLKISFRFPNGVREDYLDNDILDALQSVGCYHLDFGIESGSQKVLDLMRKGKRVEEIAKKVYLCHKKGFRLSASFLFGIPGETLKDMEETIRFAISLPLDSASFSVAMPFPGTELRKEAIKKGYLVHNEYQWYSLDLETCKPPIETPEWSGEDLKRIVKKAKQKFFCRPKQVINLLPRVVFNSAQLKRYAIKLFKVIKR